MVLEAISLLGLSACTSLHITAVPISSAQTLEVKAGQRVRVTGKLGDRTHFRVTAVESDALRGANHHVRFADIALLEVRRFDKRKTVVLVTAVAGLVLIAVAQVAHGYDELLDYR